MTIFIAICPFLTLPTLVFADLENKSSAPVAEGGHISPNRIEDSVIGIEQKEGLDVSILPSPSPLAEVLAVISYYTASRDETDDTPTIMASGKKVYLGAVANNCLPFGTRVMIDDVLYTVEDRMNIRWSCEHYDIFVQSKKQALELGRQEKEVLIYN